jgi:hypothetical protein
MITAWILSGTERTDTWIRVFGGVSVPLLTVIPEIAYLPEVGFAAVFRVDIDALTPDQIDRLVGHLALRFCVRQDDVRQGLKVEGLPLLADDLLIVAAEEATPSLEVTHARGFPLPGAPPTLCGAPGAEPIMCGEITCERCIAILGNVQLLKEAALAAGAPKASDMPASAR